MCNLAFVNTWQPLYEGIGLQAEFSHPPKPPTAVLLAATLQCHCYLSLSQYIHTQINVKCMKIVSLYCIWLLLRTNVIGNLFVKELVMSELNKQPCHTLPMQEIL